MTRTPSLPEHMTVEEIAKRMGRDVQTIRLGIQQKLFPFALAIKGAGDHYAYVISRAGFERWWAEGICDAPTDPTAPISPFIRRRAA